MKYLVIVWFVFSSCFCCFAYGPKDGFAPVIKLPELKKRIVARTRLEQLKPGEKLSPEDVEVLLQSILYYSRIGLYNSNITDYTVQLSSAAAIEKFYGADTIAGYCILAQKLNIIYFQDFGISKDHMAPLEVSEAFDGKEFHATLVVQMPDGNYYLIDPTFRQFFSATGREGELLNRVGYALCETKKGKELAVRLMVKGYARLSDELADLYVKAFQVDKPQPKTYDIDHMLEKRDKEVKASKILFGDSIPEVPSLRELKFQFLQSK